MSPQPVSPDMGEVLRLWLGSVASITAITGTRIALSLTGPAPAIRYGLVRGDNNPGAGAVAATYAVECWGAGGNAPDDGTSLLLARTLLSVVPDFCGTIGSVKVAGASARYPYRADDTTTGRPRHIVELTFLASP